MKPGAIAAGFWNDVFPNSDDVAADGAPHMDEVLNTLTLNYDEENDRIYLSDRYADWYIGDITFYGIRVINEDHSCG